MCPRLRPPDQAPSTVPSDHSGSPEGEPRGRSLDPSTHPGRTAAPAPAPDDAPARTAPGRSLFTPLFIDAVARRASSEVPRLDTPRKVDVLRR